MNISRYPLLVFLFICTLVMTAGCDGGQEDPGDDDDDQTSSSPTPRPDADGDGVPAKDDCDDANASAYPGALEACDGADNDCDAAVDEDVVGTFFRDRDGDGYGDAREAVSTCPAPHGYVSQSGDCDDQDAVTYPGAPELCDERDNDCDGQVDDAASSPWYFDEDGDGYGVEEEVVRGCPRPGGYAASPGDCDDKDELTYPGADEQCDQQDNDCDGELDEDAEPTIVYYRDADEDGYGSSVETMLSCEQPAGFTLRSGDCDDSSASSYPGAADTCDGHDNNCDGTIDEGLNSALYYRDADGDGHGAAGITTTACSAPEGYASSSDDCDDSSASTWPGAREVCDARDNDCDATADEELPGRYYRDQDGDGFGATGVTACAAGEGFVRARGDCNDSDPAIHPGAYDAAGDGVDQDCGGTSGAETHVGLSAASYPTLQLALDQAAPGTTIWVGPRTYVEKEVRFKGKAVTLISTHFATETIIDAAGGGNGVTFDAKETAGSVLDGFTIRNGYAGIYMTSASPTVLNVVITGNTRGGVSLVSSHPLMRDCSIIGNSGAPGGGMALKSSNPILERCLIAANSDVSRYASIQTSSPIPAGGMALHSSNPSISNTIIAANSSVYFAGGLSANASSPTLTNCAVVGNRVPEFGGGVMVFQGSSAPVISHSILAYNTGYDLYLQSDAKLGVPAPVVTWSDLFHPLFASHNLENLGPTNLEVDPGFMSWNNLLDTSFDLHLRPGSPLIDAGDAALSDPDGSRADIGPYGGAGADIGFYLDLDDDGMYDGWEQAGGLDDTRNDSLLDNDGDGARNLDELHAASSPSTADTDGDGASDGAELAADSDPTDWYSQPGAGERAVASVPGDFMTLQEAVDRVRWLGAIEVAPGELLGGVTITNRDLRMGSSDGADATVLSTTSGRVVTGSWSKLELNDLTVTGGHAQYGGGIYLNRCQATMDGMIIRGNYADTATYSDEIHDLLYPGGGGVYVRASDVALSYSELEDNEASSDYIDEGYHYYLGGHGGALAAEAANLRLDHCTIRGNRSNAEAGGGLYLDASTVVISHSLVEENNAYLGRGGGLVSWKSALTIEDSTIRANTAYRYGGAEIYYGTAAITRCQFNDNSGDLGGGLAVLTSNTTISHSTFVMNAATSGGGVYISSESDSASAVITGSILAHNIGHNLYAESTKGVQASTSVTWSLLYSPSGLNHNLPALDASNRVADPLFMAISNDSNAANEDLHLSPGSPAIDAADPATEDPDGTRADMGAFGGAQADVAYYADADRDGMYDGWERAHGLNATRNDASSDLDGDGLTNAQEFTALTDPQLPDSDGDGATDGAEKKAGVDPLDWYSQPGTSGVVTAKVPEHFPTIQAAIDRATKEGRIDVAPGIYQERLRIVGKSVAIRGRAGAGATEITYGEESVVTVSRAALDLSALTIRGMPSHSLYYYTIGISFLDSSGRLNDLIVTDAEGIGIYLERSSPEISNCLIEDNRGWALLAESAGPNITRTRFLRNDGGVILKDSNPTISNSVISLTTYSHGMELNEGSNPVVMNTVITGNAMRGVEIYESTGTFTNCIVANNKSAGYNLYSSSPTLSYVAVTGNLDSGIGMSGTSSKPVISNSIVAGNSAYSVKNSSTNSAQPTLSYNIISGSVSGVTLNSTNKQTDPKFLTYVDGRPTNLHLSVSSPCINAGDPGLKDPDGTRADVGAYGGTGASDWDLDDDTLPDYFWPGTITNAPAGFSAAGYDCDDLDAAVGACSSGCIATALPGDWRGEYFSNKTLSGDPVMQRGHGFGSLSFSAGSSSPGAECGLPADGFSGRWTRDLFVMEGDCQFTLVSDDGVMVWFDETLVQDQWSPRASSTTNFSVPVSFTGWHTLRTEYYDESGSASVNLSWTCY